MPTDTSTAITGALATLSQILADPKCVDELYDAAHDLPALSGALSDPRTTEGAAYALAPAVWGNERTGVEDMITPAFLATAARLAWRVGGVALDAELMIEAGDGGEQLRRATDAQRFLVAAALVAAQMIAPPPKPAKGKKAKAPTPPMITAAPRDAGDLAADELLSTVRGLLARLQDDPADPEGPASSVLYDEWGAVSPQLGPAIADTEGAPDSIARALGSVVWGEKLCPPAHPSIGGAALSALELSAPILLAHQVGGPLAAAVDELYLLTATVAMEAIGATREAA